MERLNISRVGAIGVNSDVLPFDMPLEAISDGINFRVLDGYFTPFNGSKEVLVNPGFDTNAGLLMHVRIKDGDFWVQCGRNGVYANAGDIWGDYSRLDYALAVGRELYWTGTQIGQNVILNHPDIGPEAWLNNVGQASLVSLPFSSTETWAERGLRCEAMRVHKNFLFALNLKGSEDLPNGLRISHPADINGYPFTWDDEDDSSIAIRTQLGGDGGEIIDGKTLNDDFIVYSRESIDKFTFSPGVDFNWVRTEVSTTVGLLSTNCIVEVKGVHYFLSDGDIYRFDGTNFESILHGRLLRRFNSRTNKEFRHNAYAVVQPVLKEIWFCVPEDENITASVAFVFNWRDNSFSIRKLPDNIVHSDYGFNPESVDLTDFAYWDQDAGTWDEDTAPWDAESLGAVDDILCGITTQGALFNIDPVDVTNQDLDCLFERTDIPINDVSGTFTVSRIYPKATGAAFNVEIGSQQTIDGDIDWKPIQVFNPGVDRSLTLRTTGEFFCYRITSIGTQRFKFSGMMIEYSQAGLR